MDPSFSNSAEYRLRTAAMGLRFFSAALRCLTLAISTSSSRMESAAISVGIELSLWSIWFADHRDLSDISQIDQGATFIWKCTDSVHKSEEHTSELQSLMRISSAVFCLKKKHTRITQTPHNSTMK